MNPQREPVLSPSDARAQRRWLIGLAITVAFGIFGAVMAVLAYKNSSKPPTGPSRAAPSSPAAPAPAPADPDADKPGRGNGNGRK